MAMTNGTDGGKRSVSSLGELPRNVAPPRDLWPSIASQIAASNAVAPATRERSGFRPTGMQWAALAAVVSALAVGVWLGRSVLPPVGAPPPAQVAASGSQPSTATGATPGAPTAADPASAATAAPVDPNALPASFVTDPRYTMQRATLISGLEAQLKTLPPVTQKKVATSLTTIRASIHDLQDALGRDPANALLQELLVNSYQDEMRVLTAVHEAGGVSGGI